MGWVVVRQVEGKREWLKSSLSIGSPCECEHNNPDSLDARLFPSVVLAVAPAVTMDEPYSLSLCTQNGLTLTLGQPTEPGCCTDKKNILNHELG